MSRSIFTYSVLLGMGGALATALAIAIMILFTSVPIQLPISTLEVSRLLANQPISGANVVPRTVELRAAPGFADGLTPVEHTMKRAIAHSLRVDAKQLRFAMANDALLPSTGINGNYARNIVESERLFGSDPRFGAMIIGPFDAALRLPDGRWRVVSTAGHGPGPQWQVGIFKLIALAVIGIVPLAWLVSRLLARPIHAFAMSADRVGRGVYEEVPVAGPTEIRQAAAAINDMQRRIEALIRERTAVVGAIAHDLRTPLARMRFLAARLGDAERARFEAEIAGMEHMIAVTMDFVQSKTQQPDFSKVDLGAVLQIAVQDLRDLGHDVRMDDPAPPLVVLGDTVLLGRLFANLLGNAIKYGTRAEIRLIEVDGHAVVTVTDGGPGMTKAGLERAFEPFFREETSRNRATGGIGLGLSIVQTLVELHHGRISLENGANGGLRATVRLPICR
ncbi:HAMP domain-containing sensor histidine kinase [Novosphingobium sp.]|uniref:sensor histidine kinase n=1 Tax=Novosphingobium sp. TaxID=1874826 RepID=UPI0026095FFA|nr:HAMP domain-containing sensor histidine kinase [Novosphingobium sp.]